MLFWGSLWLTVGPQSVCAPGVEGHHGAPSLSPQTKLSCLLGSSGLEGESSHLLSSSELTHQCQKSPMSRVI